MDGSYVLSWQVLGVLLLYGLMLLDCTTGGSMYVAKFKRRVGVRCHHCVYHYATESYQECRHPSSYGGTSGYEDCHGRCYVRMDPNGYVYRGCVTRIIFPGVDSYREGACSYQGYPSALWWFCDGALCNSADLMEKCKDPVYPTFKDFTICDGHCRDPTGTYPDPHNSTFRIQCGFGDVNGQHCECCKQYYLRCPADTHWENEIKQCMSGKKTPLTGEGYTYGFQ